MMTPPDLGTFLAAIRQQESGGRYTVGPNAANASGAYQFIPGTWHTALTQAGMENLYLQYPQAYLAPQEVQDRAAAAYATSLYNGPAMQSWYKAAEAWYGGPGAIGHESWGSQYGGPSVGAYARSVTDRMQKAGSPPSGAFADTTGAQPISATTAVDETKCLLEWPHIGPVGGGCAVNGKQWRVIKGWSLVFIGAGIGLIGILVLARQRLPLEALRTAVPLPVKPLIPKPEAKKEAA
jgi:hypothetical protein